MKNTLDVRTVDLISVKVYCPNNMTSRKILLQLNDNYNSTASYQFQISSGFESSKPQKTRVFHDCAEDVFSVGRCVSGKFGPGRRSRLCDERERGGAGLCLLAAGVGERVGEPRPAV